MADSASTKSKRNLALEEFKVLRADLLQTRTDLQRVIVYTLALASLGTALAGGVTEATQPELSQVGALLIAIIFMMLALNYVGNMRQYLAVARYVEILSKQIRESFDDGKLSEDDQMPIMYWEMFNRSVYATHLSKLILWLTFGIQSLFPIFFAGVCVAYAVQVDPSLSLAPKLLLGVVSMFAAFWLLSLVYGVKELGGDIRLAKTSANPTHNASSA